MHAWHFLYTFQTKVLDHHLPGHLQDPRLLSSRDKMTNLSFWQPPIQPPTAIQLAYFLQKHSHADGYMANPKHFVQDIIQASSTYLSFFSSLCPQVQPLLSLHLKTEFIRADK